MIESDSYVRDTCIELRPDYRMGACINSYSSNTCICCASIMIHKTISTYMHALVIVRIRANRLRSKFWTKAVQLRLYRPYTNCNPYHFQYSTVIDIRALAIGSAMREV